MKYRRVYSHHFHTTIAESIHTTPNSIQCPFKVLGQFSIIYFRGLGLRIGVRVWVRVRVGVWVRVTVRVRVRVSVVLWSG